MVRLMHSRLFHVPLLSLSKQSIRRKLKTYYRCLQLIHRINNIQVQVMDSNGDPKIYNVDIKIPFPSKRHAEIAYDVLRIDAEPKRSAVTKELKLNESELVVSFSAQQSKHIRVGVNSFFDALILCTETMQEFGPPAEKYNYA